MHTFRDRASLNWSFPGPRDHQGRGLPRESQLSCAPLCSQEGPLHRPPPAPPACEAQGWDWRGKLVNFTRLSSVRCENLDTLLLAIFASLQVGIGPLTLNRSELKSSVCSVSGDWDPLVFSLNLYPFTYLSRGEKLRGQS